MEVTRPERRAVAAVAARLDEERLAADDLRVVQSAPRRHAERGEIADHVLQVLRWQHRDGAPAGLCRPAVGVWEHRCADAHVVDERAGDLVPHTRLPGLPAEPTQSAIAGL